jgi:hypothetical protein
MNRARRHQLLAAVSMALSASLAAMLRPRRALAQGSADDEVKPKIIWGILIKLASDYVLQIFTDYLKDRISSDLSPDSILKMLLNNQSASIVPLTSIVPALFGAKSAAGAENTVEGTPSTPLRVDQGRENYQAVHVSLIKFDRAGKALGFSPLGSVFTTGDRFKLQVLPTFDGVLSIDNINPRHEQRQIYPPRADDVLSIKRGIEILVPLGKDQYFEFAGATGEEQLLLTVRDPRSFGPGAAKATVTRRDEPNGSDFLQEVAAHEYPVISQTIRFQHKA